MRGERKNRREHEKVRAISGEGVRRRRTDFPKDQVSQAALKGFFLPLHLPFAGPSSSLDILLSCLAHRKLVKVLPSWVSLLQWGMCPTH